MMATGPLSGLRVIELVGLAPAPFASMILADLGAEVIRIDRAKPGVDVLALPEDPLTRSRRSIGVDTKTTEGVELVLTLCESADVLVEGFRPGVTERLGLGPEEVHARNPRLVYGRVTGWGQDGPLAGRAGHDINYIGLAGVLEPIGSSGHPPVPPLNLVGDFGGGGLMLAMGIMAALHERTGSGRGQVVDASMVDGAALLATQMYGMRSLGLWSAERGQNMLDGGAPYYDTYETADGKYVAVGAIEERFWAELLQVLELDPEELPNRFDQTQWPRVRERLAEVIGGRTRDEWDRLAAGTDACLTPVLSPEEAAAHPQNAHRQTFVDLDGTVQPAPAPRFDRTPTERPQPPRDPRADTEEVLGELGLSTEDIAKLREAGTIG